MSMQPPCTCGPLGGCASDIRDCPRHKWTVGDAPTVHEVTRVEDLRPGDVATFRFLVDARDDGRKVEYTGEVYASLDGKPCWFGYLTQHPDLRLIELVRATRPVPSPPTHACVIRARVGGGRELILFGHDDQEVSPHFCRAADGLTYTRDEIESFDILWEDTR